MLLTSNPPLWVLLPSNPPLWVLLPSNPPLWVLLPSNPPLWVLLPSNPPLWVLHPPNPPLWVLLRPPHDKTWEQRISQTRVIAPHPTPPRSSVTAAVDTDTRSRRRRFLRHSSGEHLPSRRPAQGQMSATVPADVFSRPRRHSPRRNCATNAAAAAAAARQTPPNTAP